MHSNKAKVSVLLPTDARNKYISSEGQRRLCSFTDVTWNKKNTILAEDEKSKMIENVEGVITGWGDTGLTPRNLEDAQNLRIIGVIGGSVREVHPEMVFKKGITIVNAAPALEDAVAEFTLSLMLCCVRGIVLLNTSLKERRKISWGTQTPFGSEGIGNNLTGKRIGLIGIGMIAKRLIQLLKPFRVEILAYDPYLPKKVAEELGVKTTSLEQVLSKSKIISLHAGLTEETYHMLGENELNIIQDDAILINTARGNLIDEKALIKRLKKGKLKAALDVFSQEPLALESGLRNLSNVILTPHRAGITKAVYKNIGMIVVKDFKLFFSGNPPKNILTKKKTQIMT